MNGLEERGRRVFSSFVSRSAVEEASGHPIEALRERPTPVPARPPCARDEACAICVGLYAEIDRARTAASPPIDAVAAKAAREEAARQERDRRHAEQRVAFQREDAVRKARIEVEGDPRQPPEYRGRTWDHPTKLGVAHLPTPPMRATTYDPPTEEFLDFQSYQHLVKREQHPEYYCEECVSRYAVATCTWCRSGRTVLRAGDRYDCASCGRAFQGERVCGPCLSKRPEVQERMQFEAAQRAKARGERVGRRQAIGAAELYPT